MTITYDYVVKNGRDWIEYSWLHKGEHCTALFLRPPGLPPSAAEVDWLQRMTTNQDYVIRQRQSPNPRHRPAASRPGDSGRRPPGTSLDPLETSVSANLFDL